MTLDQIRIFLAVAEREHVTRAAEALNLTQSAVSSAISALETRHGVRLFDRVGRRIALTEAGRRFVPTARKLMAESETAVLVLEDLSGEARGRLRIRASQTVASYWLPERLVALHERWPGVEIGLRIGNSSEVARAVEDGEADLGFVEGEVAQGDLQIRVVERDRLVPVVSAAHPLAAGGRIGRAAYLNGDWILREPGSGTRAAFERHLSELGLTLADLRIAMVLPSNEAILAAVRHSGYLAMLSARALPEPGTGGLAALRPEGMPQPSRAFSVLLHPQRHRTRAVEAMLALVGGEGRAGDETVQDRAR